jgi:preprotein translocase subunit YajC
MLALMLQAAPARSPLIQPVIMLVSFGLIMYFLIIRPQRKLQTDHAAMVAALKRGDEVMIDGGVIGTVVHIAEDRVTIKSAESRMIVSKVKIARVTPTANTPAAES